MANDMMWGFLIHLSRHMWSDGSTPSANWYLPSYTKENGVDIEVWDETVAFLAERGFNTVLIDLGDAVQYESHPEIAAPDAWSKAFLRKKLNEIRALGMTPIPKLNFSTAHDTWLGEYGRMVATPTYRRVCTELIDEVCELFDHPALFHLGMDDETHKQQADHAKHGECQF